MIKTNDQLAKEAAELKEKRQLMGYTQNDFATLSGVHQGNYSRMERGLLNCEVPLKKARSLYKKWVKSEVDKNDSRNTYLLSIA